MPLFRVHLLCVISMVVVVDVDVDVVDVDVDVDVVVVVVGVVVVVVVVVVVGVVVVVDVDVDVDVDAYVSATKGLKDMRLQHKITPEAIDDIMLVLLLVLFVPTESYLFVLF